MYKKIGLISLLFSFMGIAYGAEQAPPPVPVETYKINFQEVIHGVVSTGDIKANRSVIIKPEISGKIMKLNTPEGQSVNQNTVLIELDDSIASAKLKQAITKFENSKQNYERYQTLAKQGSGATVERDTALASMRFDEANVDLERASLAKTQLKAPFTGILGLRKVDIGDYVDPGQDLISIDDIDAVLVDFSVPEKFLSQLKLNQEVEVTTTADPNKTFKAKIYAISPQIDMVTHSIKARAQMTNTNHELRPGLFAKVRVVFDRKSNSILIPEQAILNLNNKTYVYVIRDGKASLVEIKTGTREGGQVEVTGGLNNQDLIAKTGLMKLYDGAQVIDVENMNK